VDGLLATGPGPDEGCLCSVGLHSVGECYNGLSRGGGLALFKKDLYSSNLQEAGQRKEH